MTAVCASRTSRPAFEWTVMALAPGRLLQQGCCGVSFAHMDGWLTEIIVSPAGLRWGSHWVLTAAELFFTTTRRYGFLLK